MRRWFLYNGFYVGFTLKMVFDSQSLNNIVVTEDLDQLRNVMTINMIYLRSDFKYHNSICDARYIFQEDK